MKFENTKVMNFEGALRGMRNPLNSWDKSDSGICKGGDSGIGCEHCAEQTKCNHTYNHTFQLGKNDLAFAQKSIRAGSEYRKFMQQIFISVDITAPLYWQREFDAYKIGVVANSTSIMHKLVNTPITIDCFETDDYEPDLLVYYENAALNDVINTKTGIIHFLETLRQHYVETKDKRYWKELTRWLPESWLQTRTVTMSYETLYVMVQERKNHKLSEWAVSFINWVRTLPYAQELIFIAEEEK